MLVVKKNWNNLLLSLLAGILLFIAWPTSGFAFLIFAALLPLFFLTEACTKKLTYFLLVWLCMFVFNAGTTWWILNSTIAGAAMAIIANSFLMSLPWLGYFIVKRKLGLYASCIAFICFWMMFEYNHYNWQLNWPWLSLGNVFASQINCIQWYEYTGVGGGTLWVLVVNALLFILLKQKNSSTKTQKIKLSSLIGVVIAIPVFLSIIINTKKPLKQKLSNNNIVIVQPNINPYEKFEANTLSTQLQLLINLSENNIDSNTRLVIWPETALSSNVELQNISTSNSYAVVHNFINKHPNITLLTGVESYKFLGTEKTTATAKKTNQGIYYDSYNAAITLQKNTVVQLYVKSKLVPGVESLPTYLNFLANIFEQFGGTAGGYATDSASKVFLVGNTIKAAPIICYESVYGEYVSTYVKKGANLLAIITNDGWWGNTQGHKQHLAYAQLRAIENRKFVARSANTGISAIIDNYGKILETKHWDTADAIKYTLPPIQNGYTTFYTLHGDYLYLIFSLFGLLVILYHLYLVATKK